MNEQKRIYCCYSLNLMTFLSTHGVRYEFMALNPNNQKKFWVYIMNDRLSDLLKAWTTQKE